MNGLNKEDVDKARAFILHLRDEIKGHEKAVAKLYDFIIEIASMFHIPVLDDDYELPVDGLSNSLTRHK